MNFNVIEFSQGTPNVADGYTVFRDRLLFVEGTYPDKQFAISGEELRGVAGRTNQAPLDYAHNTTNCKGPLDGKLGHATNFQVKDVNGRATLFGDVYVPNWLAPVLPKGETNLSCTWTRTDKGLHSVALVTEPRIDDAALMAAFSQAFPEQRDAGKDTWMKGILKALFGALQRGEVKPDEVAEFMGGGMAPPGQTKNTDQGAVNAPTTGGSGPNTTSGPNPDGQMQGGNPMKKAKKKKAMAMGSLNNAPSTAGMSATLLEVDIDALEGEKLVSYAKKLQKKMAKFQRKQQEQQQEATLQAILARFQAPQQQQGQQTGTVAFKAEIDDLANTMRFGPEQIKEFHRIAAADPASFAQVLPVLQQQMPNPAVVGFHQGSIPEQIMGMSINADEVAAQFNSDRPDQDLATFATRLYNEGNGKLSYAEALLEAGKRNPALVAARQSKTPVF